MDQTYGHPAREAMMKAIKTGKVSFQEHLDECESCRREFELLSRYLVASNPPITRPDAGAMEGLAAIPLVYESASRRRLVKGAITFDSWSQRPVTQLRDAGVGLTRRVCLEANGVTLEIVAEREQAEWEFTARIYQKNRVSSEYVLRIGRQKLLPKSQGFYHWSSKRAPGKIRLLSSSVEVRFEGLSWA
jgi:hypothetical protein